MKFVNDVYDGFTENLSPKPFKKYYKKFHNPLQKSYTQLRLTYKFQL